MADCLKKDSVKYETEYLSGWVGCETDREDGTHVLIENLCKERKCGFGITYFCSVDGVITKIWKDVVGKCALEGGSRGAGERIG